MCNLSHHIWLCRVLFGQQSCVHIFYCIMWLRLMDLVVQPSCQTPRRLISPPRPPSSWISPKSVGKAPELSLLQTPQVVKVRRKVAYFCFATSFILCLYSYMLFIAHDPLASLLICHLLCSFSELVPWLPLAPFSLPSPHSPSCAAAWGPRLWPRLLLHQDAPLLPRCATKRAESLSSKRPNHVNQRRSSDGPMG